MYEVSQTTDMVAEVSEGTYGYTYPCPGWCNALVAGPKSGAKGYMFFNVGMTLTEEGEG